MTKWLILWYFKIVIIYRVDLCLIIMSIISLIKYLNGGISMIRMEGKIL